MTASSPGRNSPLPSPSTNAIQWPDEKGEDAVYSVWLKKVRYHSKRPLSSYLPDEQPVSNLQWETKKFCFLKAATVEKMVEYFTPDDKDLNEFDPGFMMAFLSTYRAFSSLEEILELLFKRYRKFANVENTQKAEAQRVQKGIFSVLYIWVDHFPIDFREPPDYPSINKILTFVEKEMNLPNKQELLHRVQERIDIFLVSPFQDEDPLQFRLSFNEEIDYTVIEEVNNRVNKCTENVSFLSFSSQHTAEQLTYMDAELFKKLVAHDCLGCIWSRRVKGKSKENTVAATVAQFNAVSLRVVATILRCSQSKKHGAQKRAKYIEHWINIALLCRELKNFSSLKAILSGLQSASIFRLKNTWLCLPKASHLHYEELSEIFSEDSNQKTSRELLMKEGTAKWVEQDPRKSVKHKRKSHNLAVVQGTVPYLGTFLTDLMMLDTALPDYVENHLINFEKRRKEFEVIAQIKLLQESAKNYTSIHPDYSFRNWFQNINTYSEADSYTLSCELESDQCTLGGSLKRQGTFHRIRRMLSENDLTLFSKSPPSHSDDETHKDDSATNHKRNSSSSSTSSGVSTSSENSPALAHRTPHGFIARISIEGFDSTSVYKSLWLTDTVHTLPFVRSCLEKFNLEDDPTDYTLSQVLPTSELNIPMDANVFYAINSSVDSVTFKLRSKTPFVQDTKL